jgi:putative nucleotidyltransferase with HDIG domain
MPIKILNKETYDLFSKVFEEHQTLELLTNLMSHDNNTFSHSVRVGKIATDIGYDILNPNYHETIMRAGLLHDIGKIDTPRAILEKESHLDPEERIRINGHSQEGYNLLEDTGYFDHLVKDIIIAHHEYQLHAYPRSKQERREHDRTMRSANRRIDDSVLDTMREIVAISDFADALAQERPYKTAFQKQDVLETMLNEFTGNKDLVYEIEKRLY